MCMSGIVNDLMQKSKSIAQQNGRYWGEFGSGRFQFDRRLVIADHVSKVTRKEVLQFFDEFIAASSKTRAKVSFQCFGKEHKLPESTNKGQQTNVRVITAENVAKLKQELQFFEYPYNHRT